MTEQLQPSLFDRLNHLRHGHETIEEAFIRFHNAHPGVYGELAALSRRWLAQGKGRWSIDAAFQVLRWERRMAGLPDPAFEFKLNDHFRSRYARLLMEREPDLEELFEVRMLRA